MGRFLHRHRYACGVVAVILFTAPLGVARRPVWVGDEAREAAIAKEMAEGGQFLETRLAGRRLLEKPPFFYASVASSMRLRNRVTRYSTRLPSILFAALTLFSVSCMAAILFSRRAALLCCVVLATTYLFAVNAHECVVDVSLAAFVSAGLLAFVLASRRAGFPRWGPGFGIAMAGALLAKGFVGPLLLITLSFPFWRCSPDRRRLRQSVSVGVAVLPAVALLLWSGAALFSGGTPALREVVWEQQIGRFFGFSEREYSHHGRPIYFYFTALPGMLFPWIVAAPAAFLCALRRRSDRGRGRHFDAALALGFAGALLLLSIIGTKRTIYFLPVVPIAALLVGSHIDRWLSDSGTSSNRLLWAQLAVVGCAAIAIPLLPALEDGRVTGLEAAVVAVVALLCMGLSFCSRRSPRALVACLMAMALSGLFLLDRFSLPNMRVDRHTGRFFHRAEALLAPGDLVYTFNLNEHILGRACLQLSARPIAETDASRLLEELARPGAFLLAETSAIATDRLPAWAATDLDPVLVGRAGRRWVGLYRLKNVRRMDAGPWAGSRRDPVPRKILRAGADRSPSALPGARAPAGRREPLTSLAAAEKMFAKKEFSERLPVLPPRSSAFDAGVGAASSDPTRPDLLRDGTSALRNSTRGLFRFLGWEEEQPGTRIERALRAEELFESAPERIVGPKPAPILPRPRSHAARDR